MPISAWTRRGPVLWKEPPTPLPALTDDLWGIIAEYSPEPANVAAATRLPGPTMNGILMRETEKLLRRVTLRARNTHFYGFYYEFLFDGVYMPYYAWLEELIASQLETGQWRELLCTLRQAHAGSLLNSHLYAVNNVNLPMACMEPSIPERLSHDIFLREYTDHPMWEYSSDQHLSVLECYAPRRKWIEQARARRLWSWILEKVAQLRESHPHIWSVIHSIDSHGLDIEYQKRARSVWIHNAIPIIGACAQATNQTKATTIANAIRNSSVVIVTPGGILNERIPRNRESYIQSELSKFFGDVPPEEPRHLFPPYQSREDELAAYRELLHGSHRQELVYAELLDEEFNHVPPRRARHRAPKSRSKPLRLARRNGKQTHR